jgi:phospholipid/cholesterol/gamma-HCH transport system permease protein
MAAEAAFDLIGEGRDPVLALSGDWTVDTIADLDAGLRALSGKLGALPQLDVAKLGRLDVAGAYIIYRTLHDAAKDQDAPLRLVGEHATAKRLLETARKSALPAEPPEERLHGFTGFLDRTGRATADVGMEIYETIGFIGETLTAVGRVLRHPSRIRWVSVVSVMEVAGLNALPIIVLLSFFIGLVVAYLGARVLGDFGASVFTVELVAFAVLREFGVVITAVLLAGRTDSAFTAEIGAMKMRQEIDAMRVMELDPMEALVVPRVLAMMIMTPILVFAADMAGLFGGLLVAWGELGVSFSMFFQRIEDGVPPQHFWVGMIKAPFFAFVLAIVGCRQGLAVGGDVGSLGKRVTSSVVQAIFLVILLDAVFALWFLEMDL